MWASPGDSTIRKRGSPHPATLAAAAARSAASCSVSVGTLRVVLALLALTALALLDQLHLRLAPLLPWAAPPASGSFAWHDCAPRHPQIMVYNRIPKAGSTTLLVLLDKLAVANDFDVVMPTPYYDHPAALASIGAALASGRRTLVCNHFNYPELQYGGGQVAYMNVMRHPVDRCTSVYYYLRYGDRSRALKQHELERYGNATVDECMARPLEQRASCFNCEPTAQALAFCGRDGGRCDSASAGEVLHQAWANVQAHYFVGLTEQMNATVALLELLFPDFFRGASAALATMRPQKVSSSREQYVEPSREARLEVARWAATDMELYQRSAEQFRRMHTRCMIATAADLVTSS